MSEKDVLVTDEDWKFLDSTRAGKARKLLDSGKAELVTQDPPFIQIKRTVFTKQGGTKMASQSLNEYFEKETEVFIQNISGGIVSLTFYDIDGRIEPFSLPNDRRPIRLTDYFTKDIIKRSPDLRKLLMRRPPAVRLMTLDDYMRLVNKIAKESNKTEDDVVNEISEKLSRAQSRTEMMTGPQADINPITEEKKEVTKTEDLDVPGIIEDKVNPRIMQIMADCSELATNRIKAGDAINDLESTPITPDDLNYIVGNCAYKTVISWAQKQLKELEGEPV